MGVRPVIIPKILTDDLFKITSDSGNTLSDEQVSELMKYGRVSLSPECVYVWLYPAYDPAAFLDYIAFLNGEYEDADICL